MTLSAPPLARTVRDTLLAHASGPLRVVAATAWHVQGWATRTEGRRRTQRVLRELGVAGWQVCCDLELAGGERVDLVAGPGGIFVLDSAAWNGVVTVDLKGATITPFDRPSAAWTARGQHRALAPAAAGVVRALAAATGAPVPAPRPVTVIWSPFPERVAECGAVSYVAGDWLAGWLAEQPMRLDPDQLAALPGSAAWRDHCAGGR